MNNDSSKKKSQGAAVFDNTIIDESSLFNERMQFSELEKRIFLLAKELINKHHVLDVQNLSYQAARSLSGSASSASISQSIHGLISKKILFEGGALTRDTVLANATRRQMFDLIRNFPGIHMSAIRKVVGKDSKTILIHLKILEKFDLIRLVTIAGNSAYFEFSSPRELDVFHYFIQKDKILDIFRAIIKHPDSSLDELQSMLKNSISPQTLAKKISLLVDNKLITHKLKSNRLVSLKVPPDYAKALESLLTRSWIDR